MNDLLPKFYKSLREIYILSGVDALLGWDQQVNMPPGSAAFRAEQQETMSSLIHAKATSPELQKVTEALMGLLSELSPDDQVNVKETHRNLERERKLPAEFVAEKAKVSSETFNAWIVARPKSDFDAVKPLLGKLIELSRKEADLVGYKAHPYDALLDAYESYAMLAVIKPMLVSLGEELAKRIPDLKERDKNIPELKGDFPEAGQRALGLRIAKDLGLDPNESHLDTAHHPFMTRIGTGDLRITTRYDVKRPMRSLYGTIHETGHALYEQGLERSQLGRPCGRAVSLGVHESQSRFFENIIGRSFAFQKYLANILPEFFGEAAKGLTPEVLFKHVNRVNPSLIRVEADEVTYSLHVVIRMLLEEELLSGNLTVEKLPQAWDDAYEKYLGVRSPTMSDGVMQDVHWHSGMFGYFPTYALGNIYGGCLLKALRKDIPELDAQVEKGQFAQVTGWMKEKIHAPGSRYKPLDLIERATGTAVSSKPFLDYLEEKQSS